MKLETVKKHFENAKEVKSADYCGSRIYDITNFNNYDEKFIGCIWLNNCCLWDNEKGFAEIISYKEPVYTITKEQILELANATNFMKDTLKGYFPEVFKTELEVETALFAEAKKRGFKAGVVFTPTNMGCRVISKNDFLYFSNNKLYFNGFEIFDNGTWATVTPQVQLTKQQVADKFEVDVNNLTILEV